MKHYKLITCMIHGKIPLELLTRLKEEKGIITANKTPARGTSSQSDFEMKEMDILTIAVEAEQAEEIFAYLFHSLEIDREGRGMLLQEDLGRMTEYTLPEL